MNQRPPLPPLAALRAFEAAARHLSFRRAAEELAVTPTAISHQIRLLEETLRCPLFDRKARGVSLTAAGATLFPAVRDGLDRMAAGVDAVAGPRVRGTVVITAPMAFTSRWLIPRLSGFHATHPDIQLDVLASNHPVDLARGGADLAIRYGGSPVPGFETLPLVPGHFRPVVSSAHAPAGAAVWDTLPLIRYTWQTWRQDAPVWGTWFRHAGRQPPDSRQIHYSEETDAIQAVLMGHGILLANLALVAPELESGLLRCLSGPALEDCWFQLLVPSPVPRAKARALVAVKAWLLEAARSPTRTRPDSPVLPTPTP